MYYIVDPPEAGGKHLEVPRIFRNALADRVVDEVDFVDRTINVVVTEFIEN